MQITCASGADFMFWILWSVIIYVNTDFPTCYISRMKPLKFDVFFLLCGWHDDMDPVFAGTLPRDTLWCIPATAVKKCPPVRRRWRCCARMAQRKRATTFQLKNVDASWKNVVNQINERHKMSIHHWEILTTLFEFMPWWFSCFTWTGMVSETNLIPGIIALSLYYCFCH